VEEMKLSAERRAELVAELRLRELFTNKALCRRYGVSRRTLVRLRAEMMQERPLAQFGTATHHVLLFTTNVPRRAKV
jgi:hypothetical protein